MMESDPTQRIFPHADQRGLQSPPAATETLRRISWRNAIIIGGFHLVALLAFLPWFFSWTGLILAYFGRFIFGTLGINLCYHRLLTHRGFTCPKWLEHTFAILGICCVQDTPARWVSIHRRHHQQADEQGDPHSPLVSFFWAHVGWALVENPEIPRSVIFDSYVKDIVRDPFYMMVERNHVWIGLGSWAFFFLGGFIVELYLAGTIAEAVQFGFSLLLWGVIVRTVVVWHITWSVNSVAHLWGYRNFATDDHSRNNFCLGIISAGEGWHNNHHADPRAAKHGHHWWEMDDTYIIIRFLGMLGLARNIIMPNAAPTAAGTNEQSATRA